MLQFKLILLIALFSITCAQAFQNHRYPISPILNYSALPAPDHSEVSSELSLRNTGSFTYAFSQNAQQAISLSATHFQIFSARETYFKFHKKPRDISDSLKKVYESNPNGNYKRRYFMLGTSISLSTFGFVSSDFDIATGINYMSRSLEPENNGSNIPDMILERALVPSISLRYGALQTSLLYSDFNITGKIGAIQESWQIGSELTVFSDVKNS